MSGTTCPYSLIDDANMELNLSNIFLDEEVFISIFIFINSSIINSNYPFIRLVLISNTLLVYIDLSIPIEPTSLFIVLLMVHFMVVNFMFQLMFLNKGILFTNYIPPLVVMFLLDFIISLVTVIYSFIDVYGLLWLALPFNAVILCP